MSDINPQFLDKHVNEMKHDWDWRARENAKWFINTFKLDQSDEEFYATGLRDFDGIVKNDLNLLTGGRDPKSLRLLEIGCGIGRMTYHLAATFGEVHAVDVSAEMIRLARERFRDCQQAQFYETNGLNFPEFPDNYFDLIISAYVFQHVPAKEIITSNLRDAFRVLKPGGVLKFVTNGITDPEFVSLPKDTWAGVNFSGDEIRLISEETGAQLLGITGEGTQYCWSLIRKRVHHADHEPPHRFTPCILFCGRPDNPGTVNLPDRTGDTYLTLIAKGLDPEEVDATNLRVEMNGRSLLPCYVGPVGIEIRNILGLEEDGEEVIQVNLRVPDDEPGGKPAIRLRLPNGAVSNSTTIVLPHPQQKIPIIHLITNVVDGGTDIHAHGPKSLIRLFVHDPGSSVKPHEIDISIGGRLLSPERVVFLPNNAAWEVTVQLPEDSLPGQIPVELTRSGIKSCPYILDIQ